MTKKTKAAKFRELLPQILELLESYTYEGVIDILENDHDLTLTMSTFKSYLARYKDKSKSHNHSIKTQTKVNEINNNNAQFENEVENEVENKVENDDDENSDTTFDELDSIINSMGKTKSILRNK